MFILDSDHLTLLEWGSGAVGQRLHEKIKSLPEGEVVTTIITFALIHGATVLTKNHKDFSRIPDLSIEDWAV
ncbi:MAG: hypothetical protein L0220_03230 [Acidobacteria bacterium]|nr:hypothetical protein [Acidobacteriota bacterium]